ncbi:MAG TPA: sugar transferase [Catalimonadaceae bacterium]|nr:sugar transferase [Catalimonadaceae bacterium]
MYRIYIKPLIDKTVAFTVLLLASPVLLLMTILLWFANDGKPFFYQRRPGKHGRIFSILKFKTMNDKRGPDGELLSDAERLTPVGSFVRKTSLDELPQLVNVLKGDMSLIGPRPLLIEYLPRYNQRQARRHEVRPGITGWAQVNGRNRLDWPTRFEMDVWYVEHLSFWLDIKIVWMTIHKVFRAADINSTTSATMEKFMGND